MDRDFTQKSDLSQALGLQHRKPHLQGSAVSGKQSGSAQLTIFYGGMVNVYDDISADKAQAIMLLASTGKSIQNNSSCSASQYPQPTKSDLPIARKLSLQRFLVNRNHRLNAKAP